MIRRDSNVFAELGRSLLLGGQPIRFRVEGPSMAPALRSGDEVTVHPLPRPVRGDDVRVGDVLLAQLPRGLVAHRVASIEWDDAGATAEASLAPSFRGPPLVRSLVLRGDASDGADALSFERIDAAWLLGRVSLEQPCVVRLAGVSKRFHSATTLRDLLRGRLRGRVVEVLRDVELELRRGDVVAIVGPNGAGKSTLLRLIAGLVLPTSGELAVSGQTAYIGADERSFSWRLTGRQNLEFYGRLYGLAGRRLRRDVANALAESELASASERAVREYSSGMRQRLALARAILSNAEILLLDEPTRGVDESSARRLRAWIRRELVERRQRALVVATHDHGDVEELGARVVELRDGRLRS